MAEETKKIKRKVHRVMIDANKDSFYSGDYDVLQTEYLNYFDPKVNSNKFYVAEVHQSSNGEDFRLYINYGRVGDKGAENAQPFKTLSEVIKAFDKKVQQKLNKGYVRVDIAVSNRGSQKSIGTVSDKVVSGVSGATGVVKASKIDSKSALPKEIQDFVIKAYDEANQAVSLSISGKVKADMIGPLGNLGSQGIQRGRTILGNVLRQIDLKNDWFIEKLSIEYFNTIPRKLTKQEIERKAYLLNSTSRVQKELDTLELYEDSLRLLPSMLTTNIDEKYKGLQSQLRLVGGKELEYINHKISSTHARNHNFKLEVVRAFGVEQMNAPALNSSCGNVVHLFHGSRSANLVGILSSRLKLPLSLGNTVIKTGAMFGPGIYLASDSTKSANYSFGSWCGRPNKYDTAFLFIVETALGNVYKVDSTRTFTQPPAGYHSVMGCKGRNLINNEFVVYREDQVRIKYIVEVSKSRR